MFDGQQAFQKCGFSSNDEFRSHIIELQSSGLTKRDIEKNLGIATNTVNRLFKKYNLEPTQNHLLHKICRFPSKEIFIEKINKLYSTDKLTIEQVAINLGTNYITLRHYMDRNNINTRNRSECAGLHHKGERLTNNELEIVNGCLLGDGSLFEKEYSACLTYVCAYKIVCSSFKEHLAKICTANPRKYVYLDKRTNKYYTRYNISTNSNFHFMELRDKWYPKPNSMKIIPRDIVLTPETCYWWYLGDGSSGDSSLSLCTNNFTIDDVEFLISKMPVRSQRYMQKCKKTNKSYPILTITKIEDRLEFLEYIGRCRHSELTHRWAVHTGRGLLTNFCVDGFKGLSYQQKSKIKRCFELMDNK